jgi:hypothetical protein
MSSRPQAPTVVATAASQDFGSVTSQATTMEVPPSLSIIAFVASAFFATESISATFTPSRASRIAAARPLPMPSAREPAPVTIATLPLSPISGMCRASCVPGVPFVI